jgi:Skp family chaperone for outer membrane proteins
MESQQEEVRALMAKLEADRDMELGEKQKLEDEIRNKQLEIEEVRNSVEIREEEARRLQEEMAEAKRQLEVSTSHVHNMASIIF